MSPVYGAGSCSACLDYENLNRNELNKFLRSVAMFRLAAMGDCRGELALPLVWAAYNRAVLRNAKLGFTCELLVLPSVQKLGRVVFPGRLTEFVPAPALAWASCKNRAQPFVRAW